MHYSEICPPPCPFFVILIAKTIFCNSDCKKTLFQPGAMQWSFESEVLQHAAEESHNLHARHNSFAIYVIHVRLKHILYNTTYNLYCQALYHTNHSILIIMLQTYCRL